MSADLVSTGIVVTYRVDEPAMASYLGPDAMMKPTGMTIEFIDGEFIEAVITGNVILASGKPGKTVHSLRVRFESINLFPAWVGALIEQAKEDGYRRSHCNQ